MRSPWSTAESPPYRPLTSFHPLTLVTLPGATLRRLGGHLDPLTAIPILGHLCALLTASPIAVVPLPIFTRPRRSRGNLHTLRPILPTMPCSQEQRPIGSEPALPTSPPPFAPLTWMVSRIDPEEGPPDNIVVADSDPPCT